MPRTTDEYAARAFRNISNAMSGKGSDMDAFDVIAEYFGEAAPTDVASEDKAEYLDNKYDVKSRKVRLEGEWYKNCVMPMTAVIDGEETAVIPDAFGRCRYYRNGKPIRITKKNADKFSDSALCFIRAWAKALFR